MFLCTILLWEWKALLGIFKRFLGDNNDKELKRMGKIVEKINSYEEELHNLSDATLAGYTEKFKDRLADAHAWRRKWECS